ncbi:hypothetical protein B0H13DRAFT_2291367 [Mycena leptocephala]|nr:hypothetical protein B0H13DRAFT_2291367 [Mycena leptocephala]
MHWGVRRVRGCNSRNAVAAVLQRGFALETVTAAARGTRWAVAVGGERDGADEGSMRTEADADYADVFLLVETEEKSNGENSAHTGVLGRVKPEKRSSKGGEASLLLSVDGERCKVGAVGRGKTGLEGGLSLIGEGLLSQGLVVVGLGLRREVGWRYESEGDVAALMAATGSGTRAARRGRSGREGGSEGLLGGNK